MSSLGLRHVSDAMYCNVNRQCVVLNLSTCCMHYAVAESTTMVGRGGLG